MEKLKVIIVDDELPIREDLRMFSWEKYGYCLVGEARNGLEALELCTGIIPDIILTDIVMPVMNGLDFIRKVKDINPHVQIILITMYHDFEYAIDALRLGAKEYLLKGIYTEQELVNALKRAENDLALLKQVSAQEYNHIPDNIQNYNQSKNRNNVNACTQKYNTRQISKYYIKNNYYDNSTINTGICDVTSEFRFQIKEALTYINENLEKNISVKNIADHVGYSPNYFSYLFKSVTGYNIKDYINNIKMEKAVYLLKFSNLKVYEIAEKVGMPNYRYFSTMFLKHFGRSPSDFRGV